MYPYLCHGPFMPGSIDHNPARRAAQISAAREVLRSPSEPDCLQHACAVLLALSDDPFDRVQAHEVLQTMDAGGRGGGGE